MKKGQEIEVVIEKFADRGRSLSRLDGYVIFVPKAVPGDRLIARVRRRKKKYAEASIIRILEPSPLRVAPRCEYVESCGGCKWQHVDYLEQLVAKRQSVVDVLVHQGGFENVEVRPAIGSDKIFHYRNKMEYSFSASRWLTPEEIASGEQFDTDFALGLHAPGRFDRVIDLHACYLPIPLSMRIVNEFRAFAKSNDWTCWNVRSHEGYLRHLVVRTGARTDEVMVNLVTNGFDQGRFDLISGFFSTQFPEVSTFLNTNHTGVAQVAIGEEIHVGFGAGVIHDKIGDYTFEIGPSAFFQTNTEQADKLYSIVRQFAELGSNDLIYDLYCGAGTISIYLSQYVRQVIGVEQVLEAIDNARANAVANNVSNCTFIAGDLKKVFSKDFVDQYGRPDVLIVDPPRAGMHEKVVDQIVDLRPERFIYVSCNPQTQVRDLKLMQDVYSIESVQPVDLFPHTHHVENVVKLRPRSDV